MRQTGNRLAQIVLPFLYATGTLLNIPASFDIVASKCKVGKTGSEARNRL